jgi:glutathione S-transferase
VLTLYTLPISNYGAKVEIALRFKGIPFEAVPPPGGYGSPTYKAIVPAGTIPGIIDGDFALSESETIVEYLEEAHPEPPLLPTAIKARARCRQIARFHDTRLEPILRTLFPHLAPHAREAEVVDQQLALFRARLGDLATLVAPHPWLAGAELSLADLPYPPTLLMARLMLEHLGEPFALPARLAAWHERAAAHPAFAPVLEAQEAATRAWLANKR